MRQEVAFAPIVYGRWSTRPKENGAPLLEVVQQEVALRPVPTSVDEFKSLLEQQSAVLLKSRRRHWRVNRPQVVLPPSFAFVGESNQTGFHQSARWWLREAGICANSSASIWASSSVRGDRSNDHATTDEPIQPVRGRRWPRHAFANQRQCVDEPEG